MSLARSDRGNLWAVLGVLAILHFTLRPLLGPSRLAPDFLLVGLVLYAMRRRPGTAALAGFAVGLIGDAAVPAQIGAGALAHTLVGYLAAWGRAVFFPDNLLLNAVAVGIGVWIRNAVQLLASGSAPGGIVAPLLLWAPGQALTTAVAALLVMMLFRRWLDIRVE